MSLVLKEWIDGFAILVATIFVAGMVRVLLRRLRKTKYAPVLAQLAAPASNLILVIGVGAAIDVAPLAPKITLWLTDATYVLGVLIAMFLVRKALVLAIEWGARHSPRGGALQHGFIPLMKNVITI